MPETFDPGDTARLDLTGAAIEHGAPVAGDTVDFGPTYLFDAPDGRPAEFQIHKFAEGIIRVYRARTILGRGAGDELTGLAWSYLEHIEPAQLPGIARPAFFDLAYFMRLQTHRLEFDHDSFRRRVQDVAVIIDGFLDDIFGREAD
jgi:hypothetical protein